MMFVFYAVRMTNKAFLLSDNPQRAQYEEWLQETQQLLQMQQKFLEEKIGAHRKSKKALSAKQRTAKKAGREFPEEDAEQLKHVTEQQGVVQKQLEQVNAWPVKLHHKISISVQPLRKHLDGLYLKKSKTCNQSLSTPLKKKKSLFKGVS